MKRIGCLLLAVFLLAGFGLQAVSAASGTPDPQEPAFEVGSDGAKNTDSAGGVLMLLFFFFCLFFVIEAIVHFIFKARKKRHDETE